MSKTMIMDHPLVQHKVSLLRNKNTGTKEFKELVCELATLQSSSTFRRISFLM